MSRNLDEEYRNLALTALYEGLHDQQIMSDCDCTKKELLEAFHYSGSILRKNHNNEQVRMMADGVFETCIRLARCLFYPQEARVIILQGKKYTLDEKSQLDCLRRNMNDLKQIVED